MLTGTNKINISSLSNKQTNIEKNKLNKLRLLQSLSKKTAKTKHPDFDDFFNMIQPIRHNNLTEHFCYKRQKWFPSVGGPPASLLIWTDNSHLQQSVHAFQPRVTGNYQDRVNRYSEDQKLSSSPEFLRFDSFLIVGEFAKVNSPSQPFFN